MARDYKRTPRSGRSALADVQKRLAAGWPPGLTLLTGDDIYHLDAAQKALLGTLVPEEATGFALTVFGEDKVDVATVVGAARSIGMFAEQRVVFVRQGTALEGEPEALTDFAKNPPPNGYLIVRAPALDLRRKLHKALGSGLTLQFKASTDPSRAGADVEALARDRGIALNPAAASFLAEATQGDLHRASTELEKLALLAGGESKRPISLDDVRQVVASGGLLSGWELANAIMVRDRVEALAAARRLVDNGEEPIKIVGGLAWRSRMMLQAKALLERGVGKKEVITATRAWRDQENLLKGLRLYTLDEILAFPAHLLEADRALKSRSIGGRAVLETLVDRITGPGAKR